MPSESLDNTQILSLFNQGATAEQIAEALNRDPVMIGLVIKSHVDSKRKMSLEERYGDLKDIAIRALAEVASTGENESARVAAAKCLIDEMDGNNGHGSNYKFDYTEIAERLLKAEAAVRPVENLIKLEDSRPQLLMSKVIKGNSEKAIDNLDEAKEIVKNEPTIEFEVVNG